MNEKVAKRRDALINLAYAAVIFGLLISVFPLLLLGGGSLFTHLSFCGNQSAPPALAG